MTLVAPSQGRKIVVLCEGNTEEIALRNFIGPRFDSDGFRSIGLRSHNLEAKIEDIFDLAPRYRKDRGVIAVFTLLDLYGLNRVSFPKDATLQQKVDAAKRWLRSNTLGVDAEFFHPHLSVHETEAWLLAEGASLGERAGVKLKPAPNAEEINFDQPPSKRVNDCFSKRRDGGYRKITDAPPLFKRLAFDPVHKTCRYFREFYDDLASVARRALG